MEDTFNDRGFGQAFRGIGETPGFGFSNTYQPSPQAQALGKVIDTLNDPRNSWMGLGKATHLLPMVGMPWLYHGTSPGRAANILKEGFDPKRIGEWWGQTFGKAQGQKGPGAYFSENPFSASGWGEVASSALGQKPTVLRVFVPKKNLLDVTNTARSPEQAARVGEWAKSRGIQALKFGSQVVVPDPASIPLKNIRPFPGPSVNDQEINSLLNDLDPHSIGIAQFFSERPTR